MYKLEKNSQVWFHGNVNKKFDASFNCIAAAQDYAQFDASTGPDEWNEKLVWTVVPGEATSDKIKNGTTSYAITKK